MEYRANKDDLAESVEKTARQVEDTGARTAGKVAGKMRGMADTIRSFNVNEYRDKMMEKVDDVQTMVDKDVDMVKTNIRDHPLESIALAAGAGILFGVALSIMGRRSLRHRMREM